MRFISMEFLSLCIKKKKNISKTKMISGVRHRHLYQRLGNVVVLISAGNDYESLIDPASYDIG